MTRFLALVFVAALLGAAPVFARVSPHETVSQRLQDNRVTITYGRPYTKDPRTGVARVVWGSTLVPHGKIWRLGADEATTLITQKPIRIGDTLVPAGAYSLYFLLGDDDSGQLLINRQIGQWGIEPYQERSELGRVPMAREPLSPPVHQFTIELGKTPGGKGILRLMWEDRQYTVSYVVAK